MIYTAEDNYDLFWSTLATIDTMDTLLGDAIVSVREVYNTEYFLDDITEHMIVYGDVVYNMMEDGIFKTLYVGEDESEFPEFYIYSVE